MPGLRRELWGSSSSVPEKTCQQQFSFHQSTHSLVVDVSQVSHWVGQPFCYTTTIRFLVESQGTGKKRCCCFPWSSRWFCHSKNRPIIIIIIVISSWQWSMILWYWCSCILIAAFGENASQLWCVIVRKRKATANFHRHNRALLELPIFLFSP